MRLALYGNTANNFYQLGKAFQQQAGIEATLYLEPAATDPLTGRPESDDPEVAENSPGWIREGEWETKSSVLWPRTSPLVDELDAYDLAIVSGTGPSMAAFSRTPSMFFVTGWDLTVTPFARGKTTVGPNRVSAKSSITSLRSRGRELASRAVRAAWQRRGIERMDRILVKRFYPYVRALRKLGIEPDHEKVTRKHYPLGIDTDRFRARDLTAVAPHARTLRERYDFIIFLPSRIMIRADPVLVERGQWKRSDALFHGFARFLAGLPPGRKDAALVCPDRPGVNDVALAKQLSRELGISDRVVWLEPPRPEGFTRHELTDLYSVADVVADDFGVGWVGSVALEALSVGRPLLSNVDEEVIGDLYGWHPILGTATPEGITAHLHALHRDPGYREEVGARGRTWVTEFHSLEGAAARWLDNLRSEHV